MLCACVCVCVHHGLPNLKARRCLAQGDKVEASSVANMLAHMATHGWSAENVAFGSGGALLQKLNRDTHKCAYKCSYAEVAGAPRDVYKEPVTDTGKRSKRGARNFTHPLVGRGRVCAVASCNQAHHLGPCG